MFTRTFAVVAGILYYTLWSILRDVRTSCRSSIVQEVHLVDLQSAAAYRAAQECAFDDPFCVPMAVDPPHGKGSVVVVDESTLCRMTASILERMFPFNFITTAHAAPSDMVPVAYGGGASGPADAFLTMTVYQEELDDFVGVLDRFRSRCDCGWLSWSPWFRRGTLKKHVIHDLTATGLTAKAALTELANKTLYHQRWGNETDIWIKNTRHRSTPEFLALHGENSEDRPERVSVVSRHVLLGYRPPSPSDVARHHRPSLSALLLGSWANGPPTAESQDHGGERSDAEAHSDQDEDRNTGPEGTFAISLTEVIYTATPAAENCECRPSTAGLVEMSHGVEAQALEAIARRSASMLHLRVASRQQQQQPQQHAAIPAPTERTHDEQ